MAGIVGWGKGDEVNLKRLKKSLKLIKLANQSGHLIDGVNSNIITAATLLRFGIKREEDDRECYKAYPPLFG